MKKSTIAVIVSVITILFIGCIFVQAKTPESEEITEAGRTKYFRSIEVQEGDSLWSIAEEYMTEEYSSISDYIDDVKEINGFSKDTMYAGCYLVIPFYAD